MAKAKPKTSPQPEAKQQTFEFQAEIRQLLDLLIHSVYASKEIFLRELISNAADALEKVRFLEVQGEAIDGKGIPLEIRIETREEGNEKRLIITDNGIGMSEGEVRENIGTIARSGAATFLKQLKESNKGASDISLIGRFGVGFYSIFMVSERATLATRSARAGSDPVLWTSAGAGEYTVEPAAADTPRGTRIELLLKSDEARFADADEIRGVIRKYSNFIPFPILVNGEQVNKVGALWREPPQKVSAEQYREFYRYLAHAGDDPLLQVHYAADVPLQFAALLFVPKDHPELMGFGEGEVRLQLYVKRVLIDGENKDLLPRYLRFVNGVVESEDLPLNISRETLQENRIVAKIRDTLTKKLLAQFAELAEKKPDDYKLFWKSFGRFIKEGYADFAHHEQIRALLRFNSSASADAEGLVSLDEYAGRMPAEQKAIYYLSGPSRDALERDPRLEMFRKRRIEVLYLTEIADEFVLGALMNYKEKPLRSADQAAPDDIAAVGKDHAEAAESAAPAADIAPLIARFKEILGDRVTDVCASERLVDSPACLVNPQGMSGHIDRVMRMMHKETDLPKRRLEINPRHALIGNLLKLARRDANDPFLTLACEQIFESSMLNDGFLTDPHRLTERMTQILEEAARAKSG